MIRYVRLVVAVGVLLVTVGCTPAPAADATRRASDPSGYEGGTSVPDPYEMPDVTLTDTAGQPYNLASSPSQPVTLMFFGYTNCPDVCVAQLSDIAMALRRMDAAARDQIQVVFVTTDPARDTPATISSYLSRFDPSFIGLTGSLSSIKQAGERVGVQIDQGKKLPSGGYEVNHASHIIGFDRQRGEVIWTAGTSIGALAGDFELLVERSR